MRIDLNNSNAISLINTEDLRKYQISQLIYYGYIKEENCWNRYSDSIEADLLKIIDYLDEENIAYELSENTKSIIGKTLQKREQLATIFIKAKEIKEKAVLDNDFYEFKKFIDTLPRKLKPHQLKSAFHFYILKNGANFSVPGLSLIHI